MFHSTFLLKPFNFFFFFFTFRTMTIYAPVEQQPKLGRKRDELTEVWVLEFHLCVALILPCFLMMPTG